jgi:hypothetical protein
MARGTALSLSLRGIRFLSFIFIFLNIHALVCRLFALGLPILLGSRLRRLIIHIFILFVVAVFDTLPDAPLSIFAISGCSFPYLDHIIWLGRPINVTGGALATTSHPFSETVVMHPNFTIRARTSNTFGHHLYRTRQYSYLEPRFWTNLEADHALEDFVRIGRFEIGLKFKQGARRKGISPAPVDVIRTYRAEYELATCLLLSNHPLATKLARTTSAWLLLIFDFGFKALISRRAAREVMENDSRGASMICSTFEDV